MKKLLAVIALLVSINANAYTLEDIKQNMLDAGFMVDYDAMKLNPHIMVAWKRGMSRYQCDLYTNSMLKEMNYPKVTQENTPDSRIEMVVNNPGLLLGCAANTSFVWLVKN
jgi:hypothetical protein